MEVLPDFPDHRLNNPLRQAELAVYRELAGSDADGTALYEVRAALNQRELDVVAWLIGVGRFALQVKGGGYRIERGVLYLMMPDGTERQVGSVLKECWDATMALHKWLQARVQDGRRSPFMVPVVIFPDMAPDEAIEAWAVQAGVRVIWGSDHLVQRLIDMAATCRFFYPPTTEEAREEVALVLGAAAPEHADEHQVHEQHAQHAQHAQRAQHAQHIEHMVVVNVYLR